jgi:hypothetical protein
MPNLRSREELLLALSEAAELEHSLACQYLFTLFSLKSSKEVSDAGQRTLLSGWRTGLRTIAFQEMGHLATVNNLLAAIGGGSYFRRLNFPQPARYNGPDATAELQPFGLDALKRFVEYERSADSPAVTIAPQPMAYKHVGELYQQIRDGLNGYAANPEALFIAPDAPQDEDLWDPTKVKTATVIRKDATGKFDGAATLAAANEAIDWIIVEGEGAATTGPKSHYQRFYQMAQQVKANLGFEPSRPVASNPWTRAVHRDAQGGTLITDELTRDVAELFNVSYETMLLMFTQYYEFASKPDAQTALRQALKDTMSGIIRPIGEALTELPMGKEPGLKDKTAGACFEIYGDFRLTTRPQVARDVFLERLEAQGEEAVRLSGLTGLPPSVQSALDEVKDNVVKIRTDLKKVSFG